MHGKLGIFVRFVVFYTVVILLLSGLTSVSWQQDEQPLHGGTLTVGYQYDPRIFNLLVYHGTSSAMLSINCIGGRLLKWDYDWSGPIPEMAESYEASSDGKVFTFHLLRNVTWHDGTPFTSADVKFWYECLAGWREEQPKSTAMSSLLARANITSIEAPDDYTVIMRFDKFTLPQIFAGATGDARIGAPMHLLEGQLVEDSVTSYAPVGTGPFKFVEYVKDSHVILEKYEEYWKEPLPYLDQLVFRVIPTQESALMALQTGEIDMIHESLGVPYAEAKSLDETEGFEVQSWLAERVMRIAFNQRPEAVEKHPWLTDVKVREAFGHAIDRQGIVDVVYHGLTETVWGPIPKGMEFYYNPKMNEMEPLYDPQLANQLLDEAGYPKDDEGIRFTADLPYLPEPGVSQVAEIIKENMRSVGVHINIVTMEYATYLEKYEYSAEGLGDTPLCIIMGGVGPDPERLVQQYHSTSTSDNNGYNSWWYNNSRVDELLNEAGSVLDSEERKELYYELAEEMANEYANVWLYNSFLIRAWNTDFRGFKELNAGKPSSYYTGLENVWWTQGESLQEPVAWWIYGIVAVVVIVAIVGGIVYLRKRRT